MKPCPLCGGVLDVQDATAVIVMVPMYYVPGKHDLYTKRVDRRVAACTACEYLEER